MNRRFMLLVAFFITVVLVVTISRRNSYSASSWQPPERNTETRPVPYSEKEPGPTGPYLEAGSTRPNGEPFSQRLVTAKLRKEDISWLYSRFPDANTTVYIVDDDPEKLQIPKNKGRESMVYLTYMIDNYDRLPDISIFFHPHQFAWHNSDLQGQNFLTMLEMLNPAYVARVGYMPLRCQHNPGCPNWLHLDLPDDQLDPYLRKEENYFTSKVWWELHPDQPLPKSISQPCCSQFAVSKERIHSNPVSEYQRYRDWLLNTELDDEISGRWMEYSWQYLFTGQPEFCPSQNICFCDGYGICFGSDAEFQHWLDKREIMLCRLEEAHRLEEQKSWPEKQFSLKKDAAAMEEWLAEKKQKAIERGKDPRNRALDCGRDWHQGDGF
jgi:Protein of unknown function (DUF3431)